MADAEDAASSSGDDDALREKLDSLPNKRLNYAEQLSVRELCKDMSFFQQVSKAVLARLLDVMTLVNCEKEMVVVEQEARDDLSMYIVLHGAVAVHHMDPAILARKRRAQSNLVKDENEEEKRENDLDDRFGQQVAILEVGDITGVASLMQGTPASCSIVSLENGTKLARLRSSDYARVMSPFAANHTYIHIPHFDGSNEIGPALRFTAFQESVLVPILEKKRNQRSEYELWLLLHTMLDVTDPVFIAKCAGFQQQHVKPAIRDARAEQRAKVEAAMLENRRQYVAQMELQRRQHEDEVTQLAVDSLSKTVEVATETVDIEAILIDCKQPELLDIFCSFVPVNEGTFFSARFYPVESTPRELRDDSKGMAVDACYCAKGVEHHMKVFKPREQGIFVVQFDNSVGFDAPLTVNVKIDVITPLKRRMKSETQNNNATPSSSVSSAISSFSSSSSSSASSFSSLSSTSVSSAASTFSSFSSASSSFQDYKDDGDGGEQELKWFNDNPAVFALMQEEMEHDTALAGRGKCEEDEQVSGLTGVGMIRLLRYLPREEQVTVLKRMGVRKLEQKELLYRQGNKTVFHESHFYFVLGGSLSVHTKSDNKHKAEVTSTNNPFLFNKRHNSALQVGALPREASVLQAKEDGYIEIGNAVESFGECIDVISPGFCCGHHELLTHLQPTFDRPFLGVGGMGVPLVGAAEALDAAEHGQGETTASTMQLFHSRQSMRFLQTSLTHVARRAHSVVAREPTVLVSLPFALYGDIVARLTMRQAVALLRRQPSARDEHALRILRATAVLLPFFRRQSREAAVHMMREGELRSLEMGEVVYDVGGLADAAYIVLDGRVAVTCGSLHEDFGIPRIEEGEKGLCVDDNALLLIESCTVEDSDVGEVTGYAVSPGETFGFTELNMACEVLEAHRQVKTACDMVYYRRSSAVCLERANVLVLPKRVFHAVFHFPCETKGVRTRWSNGLTGPRNARKSDSRSSKSKKKEEEMLNESKEDDEESPEERKRRQHTLSLREMVAHTCIFSGFDHVDTICRVLQKKPLQRTPLELAFLGQCLKQLQIFEGLEPGIRAYCCQQMNFKLVRRSEVVQQQYDRVTDVFIVLTGSLSVTYKEPDKNDLESQTSLLDICQRQFHEVVSKETFGERYHRLQKEKDKNVCLFHALPGMVVGLGSYMIFSPNHNLCYATTCFADCDSLVLVLPEILFKLVNTSILHRLSNKADKAEKRRPMRGNAADLISSHDSHGHSQRNRNDMLKAAKQRMLYIKSGEAIHGVSLYPTWNRTGMRLKLIQMGQQSLARAAKRLDAGMEFMSNVGIFRGMSANQISFIFAHAEKLEFQSGSVIVPQGTTSDCVYVIHSGFCSFTRSVSLHQNRKLFQRQDRGSNALLQVHIPWVLDWHMEGVSDVQNVLSKTKPGSKHVYTRAKVSKRDMKAADENGDQQQPKRSTTESLRKGVQPWWHQDADDGENVAEQQVDESARSANPFQLWAHSVKGETSRAVVKAILSVNPLIRERIARTLRKYESKGERVLAFRGMEMSTIGPGEVFGLEYDPVGYDPEQVSACAVVARTPLTVYKISMADVMQCWHKLTLFAYRSIAVRRRFLHDIRMHHKILQRLFADDVYEKVREWTLGLASAEIKKQLNQSLKEGSAKWEPFDQVAKFRPGQVLTMSQYRQKKRYYASTLGGQLELLRKCENGDAPSDNDDDEDDLGLKHVVRHRSRKSMEAIHDADLISRSVNGELAKDGSDHTVFQAALHNKLQKAVGLLPDEVLFEKPHSSMSLTGNQIDFITDSVKRKKLQEVLLAQSKRVDRLPAEFDGDYQFEVPLKLQPARVNPVTMADRKALEVSVKEDLSREPPISSPVMKRFLPVDEEHAKFKETLAVYRIGKALHARELQITAEMQIDEFYEEKERKRVSEELASMTMDEKEVRPRTAPTGLRLLSPAKTQTSSFHSNLLPSVEHQQQQEQHHLQEDLGSDTDSDAPKESLKVIQNGKDDEPLALLIEQAKVEAEGLLTSRGKEEEEEEEDGKDGNAPETLSITNVQLSNDFANEDTLGETTTPRTRRKVSRPARNNKDRVAKELPRWNKREPRIRPHSAKLRVLSSNVTAISKERQEISKRSGPAAFVKTAAFFDNTAAKELARNKRAAMQVPHKQIIPSFLSQPAPAVSRALNTTATTTATTTIGTTANPAQAAKLQPSTTTTDTEEAVDTRKKAPRPQSAVMRGSQSSILIPTSPVPWEAGEDGENRRMVRPSSAIHLRSAQKLKEHAMPRIQSRLLRRAPSSGRPLSAVERKQRLEQHVGPVQKLKQRQNAMELFKAKRNSLQLEVTPQQQRPLSGIRRSEKRDAPAAVVWPPGLIQHSNTDVFANRSEAVQRAQLKQKRSTGAKKSSFRPVSAPMQRKAVPDTSVEEDAQRRVSTLLRTGDVNQLKQQQQQSTRPLSATLVISKAGKRFNASQYRRAAVPFQGRAMLRSQSTRQALLVRAKGL